MTEDLQTYQPQVDDIFKNHDEFVNKIKGYAQKLGFIIRLGKVKYLKSTKNKKSKNISKEQEEIITEKKIRTRTLLCSRADYSESKENDLEEDENSSSKQNRKSQRCGCSFYIRASLEDSNGLWYITNMDLIHNHQMVDESHQFFMSNERSIPNDVKQRIELLHHAGVDVPTIRSILKEEFGDCVTWVYNDIYNFIYQLEGGLEKRELDSEELLKILEQFKDDNTEFFYFADINENTKRLERVIWMFPEQRMNYSRFNDVVVFDNTYKTNCFQMPFGIFTGVNNYGHSICFSGTLMIDETEDSFLWVFTKFLEMVNQHAPLVILTDDDRAMANAYTKILQPLGTKHRLCQWHLMKNVMKNLCAKLSTNWSAFIKEFYKCLGEMDISSFLSQWNLLKTSYPSASSYLLRMEKTKEKWAPCIFMADMTTTQRGESMNNI